MLRNIDQNKLQKLLKAHDVPSVREYLAPLHQADIAALLEIMDEEDSLLLFRYLHKDMAAEVFSFLSVSNQLELVSSFSAVETGDLVDRLYVDDATDFLEELPANAVVKILANTSRQKREALNRFLKYKEDSAGSVMTIEMISIRQFWTVKEAIDNIRNDKRKLVSTAQVYITSYEHKLVGVLSIRELLQAKDDEIIKDIMRTPVISVNTDTDQEEALLMIQKYDFMALPVTDSENRLVGIITADDALDISTQEASDDFAIMAAVKPSEQSYFDSSVLYQTKNRLLWLTILTITGIVNGFILGGFEAAFTAMPILVTFIPMLTDTGGNAGSQSSTLVIRSLAIGELSARDLPKVLWKEFRISIFTGFSLAIISFIRVMIFPPHDILVALLLGLTVFVIVIVAKLCGGLLPMVANKLGLDPAMMAAPLITTIVDASGLIIFFLLARLILGV